MKKTLLAATLLAVASMAHAEPNPAKKELINKLLQIQQPAVDITASALAEQPLLRLKQQVEAAVQFRVPPERREALGKEIQGDVKKYIDEARPLLRERANKLAPSTIGVLLDEKFTEDELRQLIALLESPVQRKFNQLGQELQKSLVDKLVADTKGQIEPKLKTLEQSIGKRLEAAAQPAK
ncbi:hypothetical protein J2X19_003813 [Rhodoferax ferrireducens]|uniref:DUF2059 domain-containing protein n=1 Tax=Rhodoferax ferrireducens TaxID=192843 RepID=A0ABU2CCQ4_9BURK|nr:hypothetical protein [Rhodoferax ferrireducens]MDR7379119.1 hypothetical protein [Rhodoferax ferrireducens]